MGALTSDLPRATPAESALDPGLPGRLRAIAGRQMEAGLAEGMQIVVCRGNAVVVEECLGHRVQDDRPIDPSTRFPIFSASKPLTATAVHILAERGELAYTDPACRFLPGFGGQGKDAITVRHLLLHQAGIPDAAGTIPPERFAGPDHGLAVMRDLELEYAPGERVVYHGWTAYGLLAAIVEAIDGRDFATFTHDEVFRPLGMTSTTWGLPPEMEGEATDIAGLDETTSDLVQMWNSRTIRDGVVPAGGVHTTARDLARFYLAMANGGRLNGDRILMPATVAHAVQLHAPMIPGWTFGFGYGYMVGTGPEALLRQGALASSRSFGHPGFCTTQAHHDPAYGLTIMVLANVAPSQSDNDRRLSILCDTIYRGVMDLQVGV